MTNRTTPKGSLLEWLPSWPEADQLRQHEDKVLLVLTLIIGATVGLVVVAFILLTENLASRLYPQNAAAWRGLLIPVFGSFVAGLLLYRYFPDARGSGIPQTKTALFIRDGYISLRTVIGKFGLASFTLASGLALGREGPSVQVGAGIASVFGRRLGLSTANIRALVPIGSAAALAAAFNTPIAAVLFSLEEVLGDLHAPVLGSIVLSSATSWMVLHLLLGDEPLFHVPAYQLVHPVEFAVYAVLGIAGGLVSILFVKLLLWLRRRFQAMPESTRWFHPVAGGLAVGILGWFNPDVLGVGYAHVSSALNGQMAVSAMALLVFLKIAATTSSYASGNAGGIFGPSLFIGAMMGGAVGGAAHQLAPDYTGSAGAYALVGMGAAFAGIVRVPLTSVIMIFEVTRDYSIIVPLMIANMISYFLSARFQKEAVYEALQHQDGVHLPAGARQKDPHLVVSDGMRPAADLLWAGDTVREALDTRKGGQTAWPVVDTNGLRGVLSISQLEEAAKGGRAGTRLAGLLPPEDPEDPKTAEHFPHVHPDHSLDLVLRRIASSGISTLPVVSRANLREVVGVISVDDVLSAYGFGKSAKQPEAPKTPPPVTRLTRILAVVVGVLLVIVMINYFYRAQRSERARQAFKTGNELMQKERYNEAIERYREALSISHTGDYRLALAQALVREGRWSEAEIYLRELVRANPGSGPANLGRARVAAGLGNIQDAVAYYHRAIYGSWPGDARQQRIAARIELVNALAKAGQKKQAQAELLALVTEMPGDPDLRHKVGNMLLDFAMPKEAADVFHAAVHHDNTDAAAYAGLGNALYAQADYTNAQNAYRNAARLAPDHAIWARRAEVCEQILALDPLARRIPVSERYKRSRNLLELALAALDQCGADLAPDQAAQARKELAGRARPKSYGDATESNISLAEQLWSARSPRCKAASSVDEPLTKVLELLSR
ncbi:MAG: chloride channel protein [Bryobacterales bacterium]|nr:chloride channel protein [Bryobacterales bacterium]